MNKTFILAIYPYIIKQYNTMFESIIEKYQITQIEIDVLAFLANNPEYHHAKDIVTIRGISKSHVSLAIDKLTNKNLIERRVDEENRRCISLFVKAEAKALVGEIQAVQRNYHQRAYDGFSVEEIEQYLSLLSRIYKNLGGNNHE